MGLVRVSYDIEVPDGKEREVLDVLNSEREQGVRNFLKSHLVDEAEVLPVHVTGREAHIHTMGGGCEDHCYRVHFASKRGLPEWPE